jgi:hypothetical protein
LVIGDWGMNIEHRTSNIEHRRGVSRFKYSVSRRRKTEDLETEELRKEGAFFFEPESTICDPRAAIYDLASSDDEELLGNF